MRAVIISFMSAALLALAGPAAADIILTPGICDDADASTPECWTSDENLNPVNADAIETLVGTESELTLQYKDNVGGSEEGDFAGSYETTFSNSDEVGGMEYSDALVEYISGAIISCGECYISIKDGNANPDLYVFDISGWDGEMDIIMSGFWEGATGAISNIAIWGTGESTKVSEPATLGLLGLGLLGVGFARRRNRI